MVTKKTKEPEAALAGAENVSSQLSACAYLLVMLLQRLEGRQQGVIDELRQAVDRDLSAIPESEPDRPLAERTFQETLRILEIATAQLVTTPAE